MLEFRNSRRYDGNHTGLHKANTDSLCQGIGSSLKHP